MQALLYWPFKHLVDFPVMFFLLGLVYCTVLLIFGNLFLAFEGIIMVATMLHT